jgi:hypothetical protein
MVPAGDMRTLTVRDWIGTGRSLELEGTLVPPRARELAVARTRGPATGAKALDNGMITSDNICNTMRLTATG